MAEQTEQARKLANTLGAVDGALNGMGGIGMARGIVSAEGYLVVVTGVRDRFVRDEAAEVIEGKAYPAECVAKRAPGDLAKVVEVAWKAAQKDAAEYARMELLEKSARDKGDGKGGK